MNINKYEEEIKNRFGAAILKKMQSDYNGGFHIVGETGKTIVIGDGFTNKEYSRKTGRVLSTFNHIRTRKIARKG